MLTGKLACEVIYQGYKAVQGQYRRSDGFSPEGGFVMLNAEDFQGLTINVPEIQWRSVNGFEHDGGISIRTWERFKGKATTTADRSPAPEPKGQGVNLYGDLVLRTLSAKDGSVLKEMKYSDVYVDLAGEEVTRGLANVLNHSSGLIRVPLTDVRRYYGNYGFLFCRINCRRKSGKWDEETIKLSGGPWQMSEVVEMLFSQLPGSPDVDKQSDLYFDFFDPPMGIEGHGEPVVQHLDKLLERAGLKASMLPNGNYAVNRRMSNRLSRYSVATAVREEENVKDDLHYERFAWTSTDRPAAVVGLGPRRISRITSLYVPALKDTDGLWYALEEICKRWSYPLVDLNKEVLVAPEYKFGGVPPALGSSDADDALHQERRRILIEGAYKKYLPAFYFQDGKGGIDLDDPDLDLMPFLPMVPAAWYRSEVKNKEIGKKVPHPTTGKGDLEEFVLLPPVVRAQRVGQSLFANFDECERHFKAHMSDLSEWQTEYEGYLSEVKGLLAKAGEKLLTSEKLAPETLESGKAAEFGVEVSELDMSGDVSLALAKVGQCMSASDRIRETHDSHLAKEEVLHYSRMVKQWESRIQDRQKAVDKLNEKFGEFKKAWKDRRMIPARYNLPQMEVSCSVDSRSGLVESGVPLVLMKAPFFFDGDMEEVAADGGVNVTYGYEVKGADIGAFTNYLFKADDGGDQDKVADVSFAGSHRTSPLKSRLVPIESREYIDERGNPLNYSACWSEAKGKASQLLKLPRRVKTWVLEVIGLRKAVLDGGANSIQHEWDGAVGMTHVFVNSLGGRGPLGPPGSPKLESRFLADLQERLQSGGPEISHGL